MGRKNKRETRELETSEKLKKGMMGTSAEREQGMMGRNQKLLNARKCEKSSRYLEWRSI